MAYTNSPLVVYTKLSPNYNPRQNKITKICLHHQAGNLSLETLGNIVANPSRQMSCNYGIDSQGRVGLYCKEKNRSWCSSSAWCDHQAITVEIANDGGAPDWHVSDKALESAIELCVDVCKRNGIDKLVFTGDKNGSLVAHRYFSNTLCPGPYLYSKFPWIAEQVNKRLGSTSTPVQPTTNKGTQATTFLNMTNEQIMAKVGPLFTEDQKNTGVLACVSMAQFIIESAYGKSELAQNANNCFGMKTSLSNNSWTGSKWDGVSVYNKSTKEQSTNGDYSTIKADFRKYACVEDSIADHSAYLIGAKKGADLRYVGLKGETDYKKAAQIIKDGGYATSLSYVNTLCNVIEQYNLTKYNASSNIVQKPVTTPSQPQPSTFTVGEEVKLKSGATYTSGKSIPNWVINSKLYVREIRGNEIVFSTLKTGAITGVADKEWFIKNSTYTVKVTASALNIRSGPGTNYNKVGCITDKGIYTIVDESNGFGKLKSGAGWIALEYTEKR